MENSHPELKVSTLFLPTGVDARKVYMTSDYTLKLYYSSITGDI